MIDAFGDRIATLKSAQSAINAYRKENYPFHLVAVAQGQTVAEYLSCFDDLVRQELFHPLRLF
jgi:hypothetical protein